jgi:hypothetical protein
MASNGVDGCVRGLPVYGVFGRKPEQRPDAGSGRRDYRGQFPVLGERAKKRSVVDVDCIGKLVQRLGMP